MGHSGKVASAYGARVFALAALSLLVGAGCTARSPASSALVEPTTAAASSSSTATSAPPATASPAAAGYPLASPGSHAVGMRGLPAVSDASRGDRPVQIRIWYPALHDAASAVGDPPFIPDALPETGGPYPVILSSSKIATILAPYLVTHGFAWISVDGIDSYAKANTEMVDQPLDILFALDHVATRIPAGMEGVLDTERAGVIGYSFDGYNALALGGARIDADYYRSNCPDPDPVTASFVRELSAFGCAPAQDWDAFAARAGPGIAPGEDGLWHPMTDARIHAAMPMAGEGWWLFGERGTAAVDRPVLMLAASGDSLYAENAYLFEHLGTETKSFVTFVGPDHMMIFDRPMVERIAHFAAAFFGQHLQGREELAGLYDEAFVAQHDGLAWGTLPNR